MSNSYTPRPLSLQDAGRTFPDSLVNHHQDAGDASVPMVQLPDSIVKHHQALDHDGPVFCYLKALWIGDFKINQNIACHAL